MIKEESMKKFFVNILCAFIPSRFVRDRLRIIFSDNQIFITDEKEERKLGLFDLKNFKIGFCGKHTKNNTIKIHKNAVITGKITLIGNNSEIYIGKNVHGKYIIVTGDDSKIIISDGCYSNGLNIYSFLPSELIIGKDCLFSWDVNIFSHDGHNVWDKKTNKLLNPKSSLKIGSHCWVGYGCVITKNASLPDNTIVGAGSVVSKKFEKEYTAIGGNPAKIIKENIKWS